MGKLGAGILKLICESSIQILCYTKNTYINALSDIHKNRTGKYWTLERKYNNMNRPYLVKMLIL